MAIQHNQIVSHPPAHDGGTISSDIVLDPHATEVVLGLHWDPPEAGTMGAPADLDALCVLYGSGGEVREIVHPGSPGGGNGSVVHTGDSRTGASVWDDERIFVFLGALPVDIVKLAFIVTSAGRYSFDEVRGAVCHVSDLVNETAWVRVDLTSLAGCMAYTAATLHRGAAAWRMVSEAHLGRGVLPVEVQSLLERGKSGQAPVPLGRRQGLSDKES